jgi:biotin carboxylase
MPTSEEYWEALQRKICVKCVDGDGSGSCLIAPGSDCAMKTHFPQIIETVNSVFSPSVEPYVEQLRKKVCAVCTGQSSEGSCRLRSETDCALDRYFPLIVQVIEETQLKKRLQT